MGTNVSAELVTALIDVVRNDAGCRSHITWKTGAFPWAGFVRNTVMQTQGRLDRFGRDGNPVRLLWSDVDISRWREHFVCVGIAQWTSIAINKAVRSGAHKRDLSEVDFAGPVSCATMAHMGTGIRLKNGLSRVKRDAGYGRQPLMAYVDGTRTLTALGACDFVMDWWYRLDIDAPWIFFSKEEFDAYSGGVGVSYFHEARPVAPPAPAPR